MYQEHNPTESNLHEPDKWAQLQTWEAIPLLRQLDEKLTIKEEIIVELDKMVSELKQSLIKAQEDTSKMFTKFTTLKESIFSLLDNNRDGDEIEITLDEANQFLSDNGIQTIKSTYSVHFTITGVLEIDASNEDEAEREASDVDVTHYAGDIMDFDITIESVEKE